jgi:DNA-binding MarR family transcriptional regulator
LHDKRAEVTDALGMSFIRAKALRSLVGGARTMRELGAALAIDASYTTVVVDDLEQRGLVQRAVHDVDRRVKVVTITATGRAAARVAQRIMDKPPPALVALPPAELSALAVTLAKLVERAAAAKAEPTL